MLSDRTRTFLAHVGLLVGAAGVLATGADHLDEYAANGFSTVPTIGTLFLLNFIAAAVVGLGLLLPLRRIAPRLAERVRALLTLSGIGIATTSLIALWISETSSLFGFTDHGFRPTIIAAVIAEATAVIGLTAYLLLARVRIGVPRTLVRSH